MEGARGARGENAALGVNSKSDAISENEDLIPQASAYANKNKTQWAWNWW